MHLCFQNIATPMTDHHPIVLKRSKSKLIGILTGMFPLIYSVSTLFQKPFNQWPNFFPGSNYLFLGFLLLFLVLVVAVSVYVVRTLLSKTPGLVVSDAGILDDSSAVSGGFIPWSDIIEINARSIFGQHYLGIQVHNPDEYINRKKTWLQRFLMRRNHRQFKAVISISASSLRISHEELEDLIKRRFDAYKTGHLKYT